MVSDIVILDVDLVQELVAIFMLRGSKWENELSEVKRADSDAKANVAKIVDGYLAKIAKEPNTSLLEFSDLADMVSTLPRSTHDGIYRAIDMYLKEHPAIGKSEKKRICRLMDCRKLSLDACRHAVQNERLPLRVVVQVLFFEQPRATSTGGLVPDAAMDMAPGRSSRTNTEEEWGSVLTSEELKALKGEVERDGEKMNKAKGADIQTDIYEGVF